MRDLSILTVLRTWTRQSKNIEEILNSPLAEKVKFLTILKYITKKYCCTSLKKLDQDKNLPQLIKLLYLIHKHNSS